jgi:hypothetical protein
VKRELKRKVSAASIVANNAAAAAILAQGSQRRGAASLLLQRVSSHLSKPCIARAATAAPQLLSMRSAGHGGGVDASSLALAMPPHLRGVSLASALLPPFPSLTDDNDDEDEQLAPVGQRTQRAHSEERHYFLASPPAVAPFNNGSGNSYTSGSLSRPSSVTTEGGGLRGSGSAGAAGGGMQAMLSSLPLSSTLVAPAVAELSTPSYGAARFHSPPPSGAEAAGGGYRDSLSPPPEFAGFATPIPPALPSHHEMQL